ncbi:MAG: hypothetical protein AAGU76_05375 [Sedimentibacter sp.]|uniref:hypothetical protein n=1 Tax=Sedimentibacter sp. TaxID=1960295 RepID=UPI0031584E36
MIYSGIKLDEGLAEILNFQIKCMKRSVNDASIDDIQRANALLRNLIIALNITEEKVRMGIRLCEGDDE